MPPGEMIILADRWHCQPGRCRASVTAPAWRDGWKM